MLKSRVITALILAVGVGALLFQANALVWSLFVILASGIAAWEWSGFAGIKSPSAKIQYSVLVVVTVWFCLTVLGDQSLLLLTLISAFWMFFAVYRYQRTAGKPLVSSPVGILLLGLVAIILFSQTLVHLREVFSPQVVLLSLFVVWAIDTGAYFSGRRFGKHKLAVHVSPGKTWEGVWGGFVTAFIVSWIGLWLLQPALTFSYGMMSLAMAFIALFSVVGDLYESLLKRQAGIKDSGSIFPGHGGMLDRVDSLMIAIPMFYFLWLWTKL